jgi:hypothetical protein
VGCNGCYGRPQAARSRSSFAKPYCALIGSPGGFCGRNPPQHFDPCYNFPHAFGTAFPWSTDAFPLLYQEDELTRRLLSVLGACLIAFSALASEEKIALDNLPAKVKAALKAKYPDAKLISAEKEVQDSKTTYEVGIEDKGVKMDVIFKEDGTLVAVEKVITAKDLPKAVTQALEAKYPRATFKTVEQISKGDAESYEVLLVTAEKKMLEVTLDSNGKILETEEKKN